MLTARCQVFIQLLLLQAVESRLGGCNAHDLSQLMFGLGAMKEGSMQGLAFPPSLLRSVEQHACSMIPSFQPQVRPTDICFVRG